MTSVEKLFGVYTRNIVFSYPVTNIYDCLYVLHVNSFNSLTKSRYHCTFIFCKIPKTFAISEWHFAIYEKYIKFCIYHLVVRTGNSRYSELFIINDEPNKHFLTASLYKISFMIQWILRDLEKFFEDLLNQESPVSWIKQQKKKYCANIQVSIFIQNWYLF